jgi:hypothetical protein
VNRISGYSRDLEKLLFRRQFLIGPTTFQPNKYWNSIKLNHDLYVSIHEDLDFCRKTEGENTVILIGISIDCTDSSKSQEQILDTLFTSFTNIQSIIEASKPLAGRWAIICQNSTDTLIFNDPIGARKVFYFINGKSMWCASQPTLLNQVTTLSESADHALHDFRNSTEYIKRESAWIGNKTDYKNCYHLMPNHYLSYKQAGQIRFFPGYSISKNNDVNTLANKTAEYLENIIKSAFYRYNINIAVTSGFDSRILLAATRDIANNADYYVEDLGYLKNYNGDIWVPTSLAKKLNLKFRVVHTLQETPETWFKDLLEKNISRARVSPMIPKINSIYCKLTRNENRLAITGNITEIVRIGLSRKNYEHKIIDYAGNTDLDDIVQFTGYKHPFVYREISEWLKTIDISLIETANIFDLFFWEQRGGNWGGLYPSEQDIAIDGISPFNCRLILETCFRVPREHRITPDYHFFKLVINKLWPEVLAVPINPGPRGFGLVKQMIRKNLPVPVVNTLRKFI